MRYVFAKAYMCFYVWLLVQTMLTKQGINIHAKAYKVIAMQSKA